MHSMAGPSRISRTCSLGHSRLALSTRVERQAFRVFPTGFGDASRARFGLLLPAHSLAAARICGGRRLDLRQSALARLSPG
jgi:hypothetical protein